MKNLKCDFLGDFQSLWFLCLVAEMLRQGCIIVHSFFDSVLNLCCILQKKNESRKQAEKNMCVPLIDEMGHYLLRLPKIWAKKRG